MNWRTKLKEANVNIHLVATGAGAGFQQSLWEEPGSSTYLSGTSFPYSQQEQEEFLGFKPEHFCSQEAAIDLASVAYMKAYQFGGKNPVGLSITATVASEHEHRGEHRIYGAIMTNDKMLTIHHPLKKGVGRCQRTKDGVDSDALAFFTLLDGLGIAECGCGAPAADYQDATKLATQRFFLRPYFDSSGRRFTELPEGHYALIPGAFNPPHQGHFGMAQHVLSEYGRQAVFETTVDPPHKDKLTIQQLLQRAKSLQFNNRIFTQSLPYYLDKARAYPYTPLVLGADAMVRMLDPKWGLDTAKMFTEFAQLGTKLMVSSREINGKLVSCQDILHDLRVKQVPGWADASHVMIPLGGYWNISSTQIRNTIQ